MPQSLTRILVHTIFSTKDRRSLLGAYGYCSISSFRIEQCGKCPNSSLRREGVRALPAQPGSPAFCGSVLLRRRFLQSPPGLRANPAYTPEPRRSLAVAPLIADQRCYGETPKVSRGGSHRIRGGPGAYLVRTTAAPLTPALSPSAGEREDRPQYVGLPPLPRRGGEGRGEGENYWSCRVAPVCTELLDSH